MEKREACTLTAGWLTQLMSLCSFTAFSIAPTRTKYSFDHTSAVISFLWQWFIPCKPK